MRSEHPPRPPKKRPRNPTLPVRIQRVEGLRARLEALASERSGQRTKPPAPSHQTPGQPKAPAQRPSAEAFDVLYPENPAC